MNTETETRLREIELFCLPDQVKTHLDRVREGRLLAPAIQHDVCLDWLMLFALARSQAAEIERLREQCEKARKYLIDLADGDIDARWNDNPVGWLCGVTDTIRKSGLESFGEASVLKEQIETARGLLDVAAESMRNGKDHDFVSRIDAFLAASKQVD